MKKEYDDDDGRTIADMSGVERRNLIVPRFHSTNAINSNSGNVTLSDSEKLISDPGERTEKVKRKNQYSMNAGERRAAMRGAIMAGLVIAGILLIGIALVILVFSKFGK